MGGLSKSIDSVPIEALLKDGKSFRDRELVEMQNVPGPRSE
jgi:hypothetical protein